MQERSRSTRQKGGERAAWRRPGSKGLCNTLERAPGTAGEWATGTKTTYTKQDRQCAKGARQMDDVFWVRGGERQLDARGSQTRAVGREREAEQCWGKK